MADMWFYTCEGKQMDPVPIRELKRLVGAGTLKPTDMIWKEGLPRWIRASSLKELFPEPSSPLDQYFASSSAAKAEPAAVIPPAPAARPIAADDDEPRSRKRRRFSDDEEDADRPRRRRRQPAAGGSGTWILVAALIGGVFVLGAFVIGIVILVAGPRGQANPQPARVAVPPAEEAVNLVQPNLAGDEFVNNVLKYDTGPIAFQGVHERMVVARKNEMLEITVVTAKQARWSLTIVDGANQPQRVQVLAPVWRFAPTADGEYRIRLRRQNPGPPISASVSITRKPADAQAKDAAPLPADVLTGKGALPIAVELAPGAEHILKFRVKAKHAAHFIATPLPVPGKIVRLRIEVRSDKDDAALPAIKAPAAAGQRVDLTLQDTQIVHVHVHNASKKTTVTQFTLVYDVGN